jgi:hypothetical protein
MGDVVSIFGGEVLKEIKSTRLPGHDARKAQRYSLANIVWYKLVRVDEAPWAGEGLKEEGLANAVNISQSGIGIVLPNPLPTGTTIFLEVSFGQLKLSALGKIVYAKEDDKGYYQIGIKFLVVPPNDNIALRTYCQNEKP